MTALARTEVEAALRILAKWSDELVTSLLERPSRIVARIRAADPQLAELERLEQLVSNAGVLLTDLSAIAADVADRLELERSIEQLEPVIAAEQRERLGELRRYLAAESTELEQLERVAGVHGVLVLLAFRALESAGVDPDAIGELAGRVRAMGDDVLAGAVAVPFSSRQQEL